MLLWWIEPKIIEMGGEICKFKTGSKKVLTADSAAALSPPDPSHYRHGRPLDIQLTLPGH